MRGMTARILLVAAAFAASAAHVQAQGEALSGTVADTTGLVLPGVTVEARAAGGGGPAAVAVTDDAGRYALAGLDPASTT